MFRAVYLNLCLVLVLLPCFASANLETDIYTKIITIENDGNQTDANIKIDEQNQQQLSKYFIKAAELMLKEATANPHIDLEYWYQAEIKKAAKWVSVYKLQAAQNDENGQPQQYLYIKFSEQAVTNMLSQYAEKIWAYSRPVTIVWASINEGNGKSILSSDKARKLGVSFTELFDSIKFPVILPIGDLQDGQAISTTDINSGYNFTIKEASKRYGATNYLLMDFKYDSSQNLWQGLWRQLETEWSQPILNDNLSLLVGDIMFEYYREVIASFIVTTAYPEQYILKLNNVDFFTANTLKRRLLQSKKSITNLKIIRTIGSSMYFEVNSLLSHQQINDIFHKLEDWQVIEQHTSVASDDTNSTTRTPLVPNLVLRPIYR